MYLCVCVCVHVCVGVPNIKLVKCKIGICLCVHVSVYMHVSVCGVPLIILENVFRLGSTCSVSSEGIWASSWLCCFFLYMNVCEASGCIGCIAGHLAGPSVPGLLKDQSG